MNKSLVTLILISLLSFSLTFFLLGKNPPSINTDEAAIGYNAYSILKTGRDEYGQQFPIAFRSFDDYKPPLYIYLTVPSVAIFGLNEFAVRLPSAVMGVLAVLMTYLLANKMFKKEKIALLGALLIAISPWHLYFTRTAYETGSLAFFSGAGTYFFLKGREKWWYFLPSAIFFGLSPFLYQAAKVFTPLLLGSLIFLYLIPQKTTLLRKSLTIILFGIVLFPSFLTLISPQGSLRFRGLSIFSDPTIETAAVLEKQVDWLRNDNKSAQLFHINQAAYLREAMIDYLKHFRLDFLFFDFNDARLPYIPNQGLLYLFELPFLVLGLYYLWRATGKQNALFIFSWILFAPIPASVVSGTPNSIRLALIMPAIDIVIAVGIYSFFHDQLIRRFFVVPIIAMVLIVVFSVSYFEHMLFIHAPIENSEYWYYSFKEAAIETGKIASNYDQIIVSNSLDQPYIFFLFYLKKDPVEYQLKDGGTISGGFAANDNHFDNIKFKFINWTEMSKYKRTLFVGFPGDFGGDMGSIRTFHYLNGKRSIILLPR